MQPSVPYRFAVLAHAPEIIESVRHIAHEYTIRYNTIDLATAVPDTLKYLNNGSEVVICYGGTGNAILSSVGHSVVLIERTELDIIKPLRRARKLSKNIVLAMHNDEQYDIRLMEKLLDISIYPVTYDTEVNLLKGVEKAYDNGLRVLVGGGISKRHIESFGGAGFVIEPSLHSIQRALEHAKAIARQKRLESIRQSDIMVILKHINEGAVCVSNSSELVFLNQKAKDILGLPENPSAEELSSVCASLNPHMVLSGAKPRYGRFVEIRGEQFAVTTLPLMIDSDMRGAVTLFQEPPPIQNLNRKIVAEELNSKGFVTRGGLENLRGESPPMIALKQKITRLAATDATVQISGETGTGKELVAHALHDMSKRRRQAFVAVNFAALTPNLIESELFGYEDGAFTGAKRYGKAGLFEMANGGTIFLDEIGEISPEVQLRLLRVLEAKELMRVGGSKIVPVDVRVICASQVPLAVLTAEKKFRLDLYYRLSTLKITVPPLRERLDDIPLLLEKLLLQYEKPPQVISDNMCAAMSGRHWPGNVRELLSLIECYLISLDGDCADDSLFSTLLAENHIPLSGQKTQLDDFDPQLSMKDYVDRLKTACARNAVKFYGGNKQRAAASLGLSYTTLWRLLEGDG